MHRPLRLGLAPAGAWKQRTLPQPPRSSRGSVEAPPKITVTTVESIGDVRAPAWDAIVRAQPEYNPFVSHAFLSALEESGSITPATGWLPRHYVATTPGDAPDSPPTIVGVAPTYLCAHGAAQYVFDNSWAEYAERVLGVRYYPKLLSCVPAAPVTGPRLLAAPGATEAAVRSALAAALVADAADNGLSGAHVNFCDDKDAAALETAGYGRRVGLQYHWHNRDYASFADFEAALKQSKRKLCRQERRKCVSYGLKIERLTGDALTLNLALALHGFYVDTSTRRWGRPYLNRDFFVRLFETMPSDVLLVAAFENDDAARRGRPVATALNLVGSHALYGRHWGAAVDLPCLHFELSYYNAIEHAIENRLPRVEAGAQGEHKIARGYVPVLTLSYHALTDGRLSAAVDDFLRRERVEVGRLIEALDESASPYKKG